MASPASFWAAFGVGSPSLEVAGGNAPKEILTALEKLVSQRLHEKRSVLESGDLCVVRPEVPPDQSSVDFLLLGPTSGAPSVSVGSCFMKLFPTTSPSPRVLCVVRGESADLEELDCFRAELDAFLVTSAASNSSLEGWYEKCVRWAERCASHATPLVVKRLLLGLPVKVSPVGEADLALFSEALRVIPAMPAAEGGVGSPAMSLVVSGEEATDRACEQWTDELKRAAAEGGPRAARAAMQSVRFAANQELNRSRRFLGLATTSHHALYQCVVELRDSGAAQVIAGLLEAGGTEHLEALQTVFKILKTITTHQHTMQHTSRLL